jgi:hypothetical protein
VSLFGSSGPPPIASFQNTQPFGAYPVQQSLRGQALQIAIGTPRVTGGVGWIGDWHTIPGSSGSSKVGKGSGGGKGAVDVLYVASFAIFICQGGPNPSSYGTIWRDRSIYVPTNSQSPIPLYFSTGLRGQDPTLNTVLSAGGQFGPYPANQILGYSEMTIAWYKDANLGSSGAISNYSYEIFGQATYAGTVTVSGTSVTANAGCQSFTGTIGFPSMIELTGTVTLDGVVCPVASVNSGTSITLVSSATSGATVPFAAVLSPDALVTEAIFFLLTDFNCAHFPYASIGSMQAPYGVVNVSLTVVNWVSGDKFGGLVVGTNIAIYGAQYVIATIVSDTQLTLTTTVAGGYLYNVLFFGCGGVTNYCLAAGLGISPIIANQDTYSRYLAEWFLVGNMEMFSSEGILKFATYADSLMTGNGVTFVPNLTPVYSLSLDSFIAPQGQAPVVFSRTAPRDINNRLVLQYNNRGNQYNPEIMEDEDAWSIQYQVGRRNTGAVISLPCICEATVAQSVLSTQLKRNVYMVRKVAFTLGWAYSILEPMDLVDLPEQYPSTGFCTARILTIEEDENGNLAMTAEVLPFPILTPSLYQKASAGGFTAGFTALPGATNVPVFLELTPQMSSAVTATSFILAIALSGGPNWGGANVFVSTDGGGSYDAIGAQTINANVGYLTSGLAAVANTNVPDTTNTLSVNLQESLGDLSSFTQSQCDNNVSLALIDQEIVSWKTATLTGSNAFDLTYLRRGVFGTPCTAHSSGAPFADFSNNAASAFQLTYSPAGASGNSPTGFRVGQTLHFKFPAFNMAGQQAQALSDAVDYGYTLTAPSVRAPLSLKPYSQPQAFTPSGYGFTMAQVIAAGTTSVPISGTPSVNSFSQVVTAPAIDFAATLSGGHSPTMIIPNGPYVAQVFAIDSVGLYSTGSNLCEFTITGTGYWATFNVAFSSGTSGYEVFLGSDMNHLAGQGKQTGTPSSITIQFNLPYLGYGPPDQQAKNYHARAKPVIHGGIAATNVVSVTHGGGLSPDTISVNCPSTPSSSSEFSGRWLVLISKAGLPALQYYSEQQILSNDTGTPVCVLTMPHGSAYNFGTGDLALISTASTAATANSITDAGLISPYAQFGLGVGAGTGTASSGSPTLTVTLSGGVIAVGNYVTAPGYIPPGTTIITLSGTGPYTATLSANTLLSMSSTPVSVVVNNEIGNMVRVLYDPTGSASPADAPVTVTDTMNTGYQVTHWPNIPGTGTVFIVEAPGWSVDLVTTEAVNSVAPVSGAPLATPLVVVPVDSLAGKVALIELLAQNPNGLDSTELGDGLRMIYIVPPPDGGAPSPNYIVPVVGGVATPDASKGPNILILTPTTGNVTVVQPINYGTVAGTDTPWSLETQEDPTGTTGGWVATLDATYFTLANQITNTATSVNNTGCVLQLSTNSSGNTQETSQRVSDQPIASL